MNVYQANWAFPPKCAHCKRAVKKGQWAMRIKISDGISLDGKATADIHVNCIRQLIADVPNDSREAFEELRSLILATGDAFPDA